jgi:hypothetical protein
MFRLTQKTTLALLSAGTVLVLSCGGSSVPVRINPGFEHFRVLIEQDGTLAEAADGAVSLKKKPFDIIIHFADPDSVFVSADITPETYDAAAAGRPLQSLPGFSETGMAEELFNKDETLMISGTAPHYWHYLNRDDHRFTDVVQTEAYLVCRKKISRYSEGQNFKKQIPIEKIRQGTIYLVFMKLDWNINFTKKIEYKRFFIKIKFS